MEPKSEFLRSVYIHLAIAFISGVLLYFMLLGMFEMLVNFKLYIPSAYTSLVFAVSFVVSTVFIEHRSQNPTQPYYLIGGLIVAVIVTCIFVSTANGILLTMEYGLPSEEELIMEISILTAIAFAFIKVLEHKIRSY